MSDFVDSFFLGPVKLSVCADGVLLQEVTDFVSRRQEIVISNVIIIASSEFGLDGWIDKRGSLPSAQT